jgi:molybdopterin-binding protein
MKLSARNQIKGTIVSVDKGPVSSKVKIDIGGGTVITSSVTTETVDDLGTAIQFWAGLAETLVERARPMAAIVKRVFQIDYKYESCYGVSSFARMPCFLSPDSLML